MLTPGGWGILVYGAACRKAEGPCRHFMQMICGARAKVYMVQSAKTCRETRLGN